MGWYDALDEKLRGFMPGGGFTPESYRNRAPGGGLSEDDWSQIDAGGSNYDYGGYSGGPLNVSPPGPPGMAPMPGGGGGMGMSTGFDRTGGMGMGGSAGFSPLPQLGGSSYDAGPNAQPELRDPGWVEKYALPGAAIAAHGLSAWGNLRAAGNEGRALDAQTEMTREEMAARRRREEEDRQRRQGRGQALAPILQQLMAEYQGGGGY